MAAFILPPIAARQLIGTLDTQRAYGNKMSSSRIAFSSAMSVYCTSPQNLTNSSSCVKIHHRNDECEISTFTNEDTESLDGDDPGNYGSSGSFRGGQGSGRGRNDGDSTYGSGPDDSGDGCSLGFISRLWPGWRRRVVADPDFPFKVLMEETVGLGLAASGMIAARGRSILSELDFALCDIAVGATLNFILVYLLSPTVSPGLSVAKSAQSSRAIASLPSNLFAKGNFSTSARAVSFMYKGLLFAVCGFVGSVVGTSLSQGLIALRKIAAGSEKCVPKKPLPNIAFNSLAWAGFMFLSSNPRYQAVAGLERVLFDHAPETVAKMGCGAARTLNNIIGGAIWVWWARLLRLQSNEEVET